MRVGILALALGLGLAAMAQAQTLSSFMGRPITFGSTGNTSQEIQNVPIDTTTALAQFPQQPGQTASSFLSFFPSFTMPSFPPLFGQSALPAPSSFPSTHYPNAFQPLPPVIPSTTP